MRILSNFHDYYDGVQKQDQDRSIIYNRETKQVTEGRDRSGRTVTNQMNYYVNTFGWHHIGFCGVVYPALKLNDQFFVHNFGREHYCSGHEDYIYSLEELDSFIEDSCSEKIQKQYFQNREYYRRADRNDYKRLFNGEYCKLYSSHFTKYDCPVFVIRHNKSSGADVEIIINPVLKDYQFFKKVDTFTAYQELSMYLGNIAEPRKTIPHIDDKTMAEIKGFDKFSFRKEPTKKK